MGVHFAFGADDVDEMAFMSLGALHNMEAFFTTSEIPDV